MGIFSRLSKKAPETTAEASIETKSKGSTLRRLFKGKENSGKPENNKALNENIEAPLEINVTKLKLHGIKPFNNDATDDTKASSTERTVVLSNTKGDKPSIVDTKTSTRILKASEEIKAVESLNSKQEDIEKPNENIVENKVEEISIPLKESSGSMKRNEIVADTTIDVACTGITESIDNIIHGLDQGKDIEQGKTLKEVVKDIESHKEAMPVEKGVEIHSIEHKDEISGVDMQDSLEKDSSKEIEGTDKGVNDNQDITLGDEIQKDVMVEKEESNIVEAVDTESHSPIIDSKQDINNSIDSTCIVDDHCKDGDTKLGNETVKGAMGIKGKNKIADRNIPENITFEKTKAPKSKKRKDITNSIEPMQAGDKEANNKTIEKGTPKKKVSSHKKGKNMKDSIDNISTPCTDAFNQGIDPNENKTFDNVQSKASEIDTDQINNIPNKVDTSPGSSRAATHLVLTPIEPKDKLSDSKEYVLVYSHQHSNDGSSTLALQQQASDIIAPLDTKNKTVRGIVANNGFRKRDSLQSIDARIPTSEIEKSKIIIGVKSGDTVSDTKKAEINALKPMEKKDTEASIENVKDTPLSTTQGDPALEENMSKEKESFDGVGNTEQNIDQSRENDILSNTLSENSVVETKAIHESEAHDVTASSAVLGDNSSPIENESFSGDTDANQLKDVELKENEEPKLLDVEKTNAEPQTDVKKVSEECINDAPEKSIENAASNENNFVAQSITTICTDKNATIESKESIDHASRCTLDEEHTWDGIEDEIQGIIESYYKGDEPEIVIPTPDIVKQVWGDIKI